jgi:hypothetical protein
MEKSSILQDHGLASLRCIRAAFDIFNPVFPQSDRQVQVIRGVWGFLPFAAEFWAVDLRELTAAPTENWHPQLVNIVSELSALLARCLPDPNAAFSGPPIEGLESMRSSFPGLWYDAKLSLQARSSGRHRVVGSDSGGKQATLATLNFGGLDFYPLLPIHRGASANVGTQMIWCIPHACITFLRITKQQYDMWSKLKTAQVSRHLSSSCSTPILAVMRTYVVISLASTLQTALAATRNAKHTNPATY